MKMYHGSPYGGLTNFDNVEPPVFFTEQYNVAFEYAVRKKLGGQKNPGINNKQPTIYTVEIFNINPFDMRKKEHKEIYSYIRNTLPDDTKIDFPKLSSEGFIDSHTRLPSYGKTRLFMEVFKDVFDSIWVAEGSGERSLALFETIGKVKIIKIEKVEEEE